MGVLLDSLSVYYQDTLILGVGRCRAAGADKWVGEGKQHYSQVGGDGDNLGTALGFLM